VRGTFKECGKRGKCQKGLRVGREAVEPGLGPHDDLLRVSEGALETLADESPFATVRLRTGAAKRYKKVKNATAVTRKTLLVAEKSLRKLNAPELLAEVAEGAIYVNGIRISQGANGFPPDLVYTRIAGTSTKCQSL
jgi:hypothetical protein